MVVLGVPALLEPVGGRGSQALPPPPPLAAVEPLQAANPGAHCGAARCSEAAASHPAGSRLLPLGRPGLPHMPLQLRRGIGVRRDVDRLRSLLLPPVPPEERVPPLGSRRGGGGEEAGAEVPGVRLRGHRAARGRLLGRLQGRRGPEGRSAPRQAVRGQAV